MNDKGLGPGLAGGVSMLLISKRNLLARVRATRIMVNSPGSTKGKLMFGVQGARRETKTHETVSVW